MTQMTASRSRLAARSGSPAGRGCAARGLAAVRPLRRLRARAQSTRVADLTTRAGEIPRRLVGYGLVVGLEGTGDRSFGGFAGETPTVRSIVNLLKRFNVVVPPEAMISRNVAAVLVTAEASPFLRAGGRFEVQVSSLGDATSLRGGVLWITPLVGDPNQPPVATAQGPLLVTGRRRPRHAAPGHVRAGFPTARSSRSIRPPSRPGASRLVLRRPDLGPPRGSPRPSTPPTVPGRPGSKIPGPSGSRPSPRLPIV